MSCITKGKDNVYLNVSITPPPLSGDLPFPVESFLCSYDETLTIPVLDNPSDYYCSIIRFSVPLQDIPLFLFPVDVHQNDPNVSNLNISIKTALGAIFTVPVRYTSQNNLTAPTPALSDPFFTNNQANSEYYYIFSFQLFINMINTALNLANLAAGTGAVSPYYIYNPVTQLISLVVDTTFIGTNAQIIMNSLLKNYLSSFQFTTSVNITNTALLYQHVLTPLPYGSPVGGPYVFSEEYISLSLWYDIRKIVITTNSIPINAEANPTVNPDAVGDGGAANYIPIITDFIVALDNANDDGTIAVYNPSSQYRLVDMTSNSPLQRISLTFNWVDKQGNLFPIYIAPNQCATCKIGFFKKSLYNCGCNTQKKM